MLKKTQKWWAHQKDTGGLSAPGKWNKCTFPYFSHYILLKTLDIMYETNIRQLWKMERRSARTPGPKECCESLGFSLPHIPDPASVLEKTTTQKYQEEGQKKPLPRACLVGPFQRPRKGAAQQDRTFFRQELLYASHSSPQNKNKPKKSYGFNPIHRNKG